MTVRCCQMVRCSHIKSYVRSSDGRVDYVAGGGEIANSYKGPFIYYVIAGRGGGVSPIYYSIT